MTFFKFEQPREAKTVYDEKGRMYAWYGEHIESGYVVQPIYEVTSTYWCDGHEVPEYDMSYGDFTVLTEMYEKPPKQKYATETFKLQEEIKTLKTELESLKEERIKLIHAQSLSVEGVLREKLSSSGLNAGEIDILVDALTNELKLYTVSTPSGQIISKDSSYVAVHLNDKAHPIHFFRKKINTWEKYNCNQIKSEADKVSFTTLEKAEEYIIDQINNEGYLLGQTLGDCAKINSIFEKHCVKPSDAWIKHFHQILEDKIENAWDDIVSKYSQISYTKKTIKSIEDIIQNLKECCESEELITEDRMRNIVGEAYAFL